MYSVVEELLLPPWTKKRQTGEKSFFKRTITILPRMWSKTVTPISLEIHMHKIFAH